LQGLARDLKSRHIKLVFSEVKGPISDKLKRARLAEIDSYLSTHEAFEAIETAQASANHAASHTSNA